MRKKLIVPFLLVGALFFAFTDLGTNTIAYFSSLEFPSFPRKKIEKLLSYLEKDNSGIPQGTEASTEGKEAETAEAKQEPSPEGESGEVVYYTVDDSYFDDAVFLGDSRIVGLSDYSGWENADFFCTSGMSVYTLFEDPPKRKHDGNWTKNIATSLSEKQYKKVYIMLGINEMGIGDADSFAVAYGDVLARIKELQPDAIIYIMSIMKVTPERDAKGDYINNVGINERNWRIAGYADNKTIFFLNVNPAVCDYDTGAMIPEYSGDGVHLYAKYYYLWTDYLKSHAVTEQ